MDNTDIIAAEYHYQRALQCFKQQRVDLGAAELQKAVQFDSSHVAAASKLGYVLEELEDSGVEIEDIRGRLLQTPDDVDARYRLAFLLFMLGRTSEAAEEWMSVAQANKPDWSKSAVKMLRKKLGVEFSPSSPLE